MAEGGSNNDDTRMKRLLSDLKTDAKTPGFGSRLHALLTDLQDYLSNQCPYELETRNNMVDTSRETGDGTDDDIELELYSITTGDVPKTNNNSK